MKEQDRAINVLLIDDDEDEYELVMECFRETQLPINVQWINKSEQITDYLYQKGNYQDQSIYPTPHLILLDLNMPCKDGREVLREIKTDPAIRRIPVIVFSTSLADEDVIITYDLGASSYIRKPLKFDDFVEVIKAIVIYWFKTVELPR